MRLSKEFLLEVKARRAMRLAQSKRRWSSDVQTAISGAEGRLAARAMTADIGGQSIKAQDIALNIDKINQAKSGFKDPLRTTHKDLFPVAKNIQKWNDLGDLASRVRQGGMERIRANPVLMNRAADAVSFSRSLSNRPPVGLSNPYMSRKLRNLHGHIVRSQVAGAAEAMGRSASEVPAFKRELPPPQSKPMSGNQQKKKY